MQNYKKSNKIRKSSMSHLQRPSKGHEQKRNKEEFQECSKSSFSPDQCLQKQQFDFAKQLQEFGLETVIIEQNTSSQHCQEIDTNNILSNLKCQQINKKQRKNKVENIKWQEKGVSIRIKQKLNDIMGKLQSLKKENLLTKAGLSELGSSVNFSITTLKNKMDKLVIEREKLLQVSNSQKKSISQLLEHNEKLLYKIRAIESKAITPHPQNSVCNQVKQLKDKYSTMMSKFVTQIESLEAEIHEMRIRQSQMNDNFIEWEKKLKVQQQQTNEMMIQLQLKEQFLQTQRSELQKKQNQVYRLRTSVQMREPEGYSYSDRKQTAHSKNQKHSRYFGRQSISPKFISQKIASQPNLHFQLSPTFFRQNSKTRTKNCLKTDRACLATDRIVSIQQNIKRDLKMMGYGY